MDFVVAGVFLLVYVGMIVGEIPRIRLDRTGFALVGAIILIATGRMSTAAAWAAIDVPTIALLFGLMVISAQLRLSGSYAALTRRMGASEHTPSGLLALVVAAAGVLSAILANDIVCLAMAPVIVEVCTARRVDSVPYLLALACAANVGSAGTLIGNPQNMLIGQSLKLSFRGYLIDGGVPALVGLGVVWLVIAALYRGRWHLESSPVIAEAPPFHRWQTLKGAAVIAVVMILFLVSPWPREVIALGGAAALLVSRKTASRELLAAVDWPLLVLFAGLFVVNAAMAQSGLVSGLLMIARRLGADLTHPSALFVATAILSNIVSNVPAVMLLLPAARHDLAGPILALSSTLAGNLLVVGSIANIIVIDQAQRLGVRINPRTHSRAGIPVGLATLAVAAGWLIFRSS